MSQENVEIVRAAFEAWMNGDLDAMLANADVEWYVLPDAPDPGPHRGRTVVLDRMALWRDMFALRGEVFEYIDAGEYVLDEVYVSKFVDGKIVELREYRTKAEALEAVGLSEQDVHADS
jgi:ketosteroid isomerase-like protein